MKKALSIIEMKVKSSFNYMFMALVIVTLAELAFSMLLKNNLEILEYSQDMSNIILIGFMILVITLQLINKNFESKNQTYTLKRLNISNNKLLLLEFITNFLYISLFYILQVLVFYLSIRIYVSSMKEDVYSFSLGNYYLASWSNRFFKLSPSLIHYLSIAVTLCCLAFDGCFSIHYPTYYLPIVLNIVIITNHVTIDQRWDFIRSVGINSLIILCEFVWLILKNKGVVKDED